jgi:hypothetical protein
MTTIVADADQTEVSTMSWGAVIAGAVVSAALTLLLLAFGMGVGFSVVSPWAGEGVSATTFQVGAGLYLVAVSMLAFTIGGYLAGRLRIKWAGVHNDEIYFRDTAHGLVVWALATVLSAAALGSATTNILGGAASGLTPAVTAVASNATDGYVDALLRADPTPSGPAATPAPGAPSGIAVDATQTRQELARLLAPALRKGGEIAAADRAYIAKVISARTGLSPAEAERRVNDVVTEAKKAVDETRKATAKLMLWIAGSMLAGALAAMLGALEGGLLRDSKWYEPGWRATIVRPHI